MPSQPFSPIASSQPSPGAPQGELAWIERIRQRAAIAGRGSGALRLGIGDDCAILAPPRGHEIVVTTDMSLEGRHFRRDWHPPAAVGHRALARGLSDLAAMGARPLAAFLSLAIPRAVAAEATWVEGFLDGLLALAAATKTPLAGGDTAEAACSDITIDIILLGATPTGRALRRTGAQPGDRIFVTGALGGSAAELATLSSTLAPAASSPAPKSRVPHPYASGRVGSMQMTIIPTSSRSPASPLANPSSAAASPPPASTSPTASPPTSRTCASPPTSPPRSRPRTSRFTRSHVLKRPRPHFTPHCTAAKTTNSSSPPRRRVVPRAIAGVPLTCIGEIRRAGRNRPLMTLITPDGTRSPLEPGGWEHLR